MRLVIDFETETFSIFRINILKIFKFLAYNACYTNILKCIAQIIKISIIVDNLADFFYKLKTIGETQSLVCKSFLFIILKL